MRTLAEPETDLDGFVSELGDAARIVAPGLRPATRGCSPAMADTFEALGRDEQALKDTDRQDAADARRRRRARCASSARSSTDLTALLEGLRGRHRGARGALPPLNDARPVGTPVQQRSPTLNEEPRKTLVAAARAGRGARHQRRAARPDRDRHHAQPAAALLRPVRDRLQLLELLLTYLAEHFSEPDTTGSAQRALLNLDRPPGGLARLDGRRRARQRRGRARAARRSTPGPAYGAAIDARRARRLRGRPARLRRAPGALLPDQRTRSPATRASPGLPGPTFTGRARVPAGQTSPPSPRRPSTPTMPSRSDREAARSNVALGCRARRDRVVAVLLRLHQGDPVRAHYEIKAAFKTSNNLRPGSPVRIAGVEVGKVTDDRAARARRRRDRDDADRRRGPAGAQPTRRPRSARGSSSRATSSST